MIPTRIERHTTRHSFDRTDDDYEGGIFEVAIPPPAPAVEGCDQVSYAGEFELLVSEAQVSATNASSFVKLPSVQELTIEAPSSAAASDAGDGAFVLYNEADGGLPTAVCLTRPVAFSGDLACVKVRRICPSMQCRTCTQCCQSLFDGSADSARVPAIAVGRVCSNVTNPPHGCSLSLSLTH